MYSKVPDDWRNTLPMIMDACSVETFEKNLLDNIYRQLTTVQNSEEFFQLCNEYFLCSVYYASIKLFHEENSGIMGLDDVENTFFKIFNTHLVHAPRIFINLPQQEFTAYLENIETQMNMALEDDDPNICNIASAIKSIIPMMKYYHQYQLAHYYLKSEFGEVANRDDYITAIIDYLSSTELELQDTVELYRKCINSRIFIKNQDLLETIFSPVFDDLLETEGIGPQTNLEHLSPNQLQDIKTIITFKQAMYNNERHGYYMNLGMFIKYAIDLLTKQHIHPYYFNLFITNMSQQSDFGTHSPILVSLKKLNIVSDIINKLCQLPSFNLVAPYLYHRDYSYSDIEEIINFAPGAIQRSVKELSLFDIVKLYYLFPRSGIIDVLEGQKLNFSTLDVAEFYPEDFSLILHFLADPNLSTHIKINHELFLHAHEYFNLNKMDEYLPVLEKLMTEKVPKNSSLYQGIKKTISSCNLHAIIHHFNQTSTSPYAAIFEDILMALNQKEYPVQQRLNKVQNICKDAMASVPLESTERLILQHTSNYIDELSQSTPRSFSSMKLLFENKTENKLSMLQAICINKNGPKPSLNDV